MALHVLKSDSSAVFACVSAINQIKRDLAAALTKFHADITSKPAGGDFVRPTDESALTIVSANGDGTLATLRTLCAEIYFVYLAHLADDLAHKAADAPPALTQPTSTSTLAALQTFLNAVKADYNVHRASTTYHYTADATNTITSADGSDQATSDTLANEIKLDFNAHMAGAPASPSIKLI
jgi:hypothetical protein